MVCVICYNLFMLHLMIRLLFFFFFFKQKTAYEMRISDWSSDVCSSDLDRNFSVTSRLCDKAPEGRGFEKRRHHGGLRAAHRPTAGIRAAPQCSPAATTLSSTPPSHAAATCLPRAQAAMPPTLWPTAPTASRSEEHTSELQSLMRTSYAVFCLKK